MRLGQTKDLAANVSVPWQLCYAQMDAFLLWYILKGDCKPTLASFPGLRQGGEKGQISTVC